MNCELSKQVKDRVEYFAKHFPSEQVKIMIEHVRRRVNERTVESVVANKAFLERYGEKSEMLQVMSELEKETDSLRAKGCSSDAICEALEELSGSLGDYDGWSKPRT